MNYYQVYWDTLNNIPPLIKYPFMTTPFLMTIGLVYATLPMLRGLFDKRNDLEEKFICGIIALIMVPFICIMITDCYYTLT